MPFQCKKEHSLPSPSLPLSLFPSSFGRILPEGKIFLLTAAAATDADADGRTSEEAKEERPSVHSKSDSVVSLEWSGKRPISLRPSVRHSG